MRISRLLISSLVILLFALSARGEASSTQTPVVSPHDGQHDFDFELGTWKTHLKVLRHPPSGAPAWVEYQGTSVVHSIWGGRANMVELAVDGPTGHFDALNLHLYNPASRQWGLNFANVTGGTMSTPTVGEFKNGRGEFYDQEAVNGRMVLVRNVWSDMTATSCHFEQAFSDDGGKTWETNWIADDTRDAGAAAMATSW
jgi:hypothetical protein